MMTKRKSILALLLFVALLMAGCGGTTQETKEIPADEIPTTEISDETTTAQPEKVTDGLTEATTAASKVTDGATEASTAAPKANKAGEITEDEALEIALKDAGVAKKDTSRVKVKREVDDGIDLYDVEFHVDQTEYNYDIDAKTGDILESDSEIDDDND